MTIVLSFSVASFSFCSTCNLNFLNTLNFTYLIIFVYSFLIKFLFRKFQSLVQSIDTVFFLLRQLNIEIPKCYDVNRLASDLQKLKLFYKVTIHPRETLKMNAKHITFVSNILKHAGLFYCLFKNVDTIIIITGVL